MLDLNHDELTTLRYALMDRVTQLNAKIRYKHFDQEAREKRVKALALLDKINKELGI